MADAKAQQLIKIKRRFGGTSHIVTSHFQKRVIFDNILETWYNNYVERTFVHAVTAGNGGQNG